MTSKGKATALMFHSILNDTFEKAMKWFKEHPAEQFAYWSKDEFLPASADENSKKAFMSDHPEIEDINDHTTIYHFGNNIVLRTFCPKLKEGIQELWDAGLDYRMFQNKTMGYEIVPEGDNFKITLYRLK